MDEKTVYSYDANTKEYVGETIARESPLEQGVFLIPACATEIAPPELGGNVAAVFDEEAGEWGVLPDRRGEVYYDTATKVQHTITKIGEEPNSNWTDIAPTDEEAAWDGEAWTVPFAILKIRKYDEIAAARYFSANGAIAINGRTYDIDTDSRLAFLGAAEAMEKGLLTSVQWKTQEGFVVLTANDFTFAALVVFAYTEACFTAESTLQTQVSAATTETELDAITWVSPDIADVIAAVEQVRTQAAGE